MKLLNSGVFLLIFGDFHGFFTGRNIKRKQRWPSEQRSRQFDGKQDNVDVIVVHNILPFFFVFFNVKITKSIQNQLVRHILKLLNNICCCNLTELVNFEV
jgi:hypothetical protein